MDKSKFDEIGALKALELLEDGEEVYDRSGVKYRKVFGEIQYKQEDGRFKTSNIPMNTFLYEEEWYIPKPFDVRRELLARPGEWVARYKSDDMADTWYKVGLDKELLLIVKAKTTDNTSVDYGSMYCSRHYIDVDNLDKYILIEAEKGEINNG